MDNEFCIDFHVHTFPEKIAAAALEKLQAKSHTRPFTDGTLSALEKSMKDSGVGFSVLQPVATRPEQVPGINNAAIKINSLSKNIISFGAMHPAFEDYEPELERISSAGIKGIKLHPVYQGLPVDDERYIKILRFASELGLVILIHAGFDIGFPGNEYAMPEKISCAIDKIQCEFKIVLAHMGGWRAWDEAERFFAAREGIFIDTTFSLGEFMPNGDGYYKTREACKLLSSEKFIELIKNFGASRVIFGTDSPWASQRESLEKFLSLPVLNSDEKNLILFKNANKLLN